MLEYRWRKVWLRGWELLSAVRDEKSGCVDDFTVIMGDVLARESIIIREILKA